MWEKSCNFHLQRRIGNHSIRMLAMPRPNRPRLTRSCQRFNSRRAANRVRGPPRTSRRMPMLLQPAAGRHIDLRRECITIYHTGTTLAMHCFVLAAKRVLLHNLRKQIWKKIVMSKDSVIQGSVCYDTEKKFKWIYKVITQSIGFD